MFAQHVERFDQAARDLDVVKPTPDVVVGDDLLDPAVHLELALLDEGHGVDETVEFTKDV